MPNILIICTANICRSPLVEAIVQDRLAKSGKTDWIVSSAGTWAEWERGAARYSIQLAQEQGLDITQHQARMITGEIAQEADLILCMTANHKESIQIDPSLRSAAGKVYLLSEMVGRSYDIVDPYGGPFEGYVTMNKEVNQLIKDGFDRIVELASQNAETV